MKAQETVDKMSLELLRQRMREREAARKLESDEAIQRVPNDFLDLLLDARDKTTGEALTEDEVSLSCISLQPTCYSCGLPRVDQSPIKHLSSSWP